jgi:hypothetical protein
VHPTPDLRPFNSKVLAAERHIVTDAGKYHLGVRVLHEQSARPALLCGIATVDQHTAELLAFLVPAKHAGKSSKQRALA